MRGHPIKVAVKRWLCEDTQRWIFDIVYELKHPIEFRPNDQDSFSAAFKWLYDRGMSEYELFNFQPEDEVDYKGSFQWFHYRSEMNKKRSFKIIEDFKYWRHDSIMKDVVEDVMRTHPLQVAQNIFIQKPFRYLHACFRYLSFPSWPIILFLPIVLFHFFMIEIEGSRNEILQILKLLSLVFIFSLIPVFLAYPDYYLIVDSFFILTTAALIAVFMFFIPKMRDRMLWGTVRRPR